MPATPAPWQAATAMPEQNVAGMESNPLPLSVGAGAVAPAYGVAGSEVAMPEEPPDSSSSKLDPSLEAVMRQAQAGLFVLPGRDAILKANLVRPRAGRPQGDGQ